MLRLTGGDTLARNNDIGPTIVATVYALVLRSFPLFCGRTSPSNVPVPCEIVYTGTRRGEMVERTRKPQGKEGEEVWRTGGGGVLERNDLRTVRK